jgi:DNA-binding transcriptional LysR family regulator
MANLYDLKKFDLNLLVIFECIYQHLSISKAAETLFITPSAVSQSLQRLRTQLDDPLFIRAGKGITPTTVGTNLHVHLEQNLNQLEQTINLMHSSGLTKKFHIYSPPMMTTSAILYPIKLLMEEHNYEIELHDMLLTADTAEDLLAYRKADLVFSYNSLSNRSVVCIPFKVINFVLICREGHPRMGNSVTNEALLNEKFTFFMTEEPGVKAFQREVATQLSDRTIAFRSDSFMSLIAMISTSDLVGYVPENVYDTYRECLNVRKIETEFALPKIEMFMMYNRAALNSALFSRFIEQLSLK